MNILIRFIAFDRLVCKQHHIILQIRMNCLHQILIPTSKYAHLQRTLKSEISKEGDGGSG